jgi:hypothetical protein
MSTFFAFSGILLPREIEEEVKKSLRNHELEDIITIDRCSNREEIEQLSLYIEDGNMAYSIVDDIIKVLKEMATIICGTSYDGQILRASNEEGNYYIILAGGSMFEVNQASITRTAHPVPIGRRAVRKVTADVIGLQGDKIAVTHIRNFDTNNLTRNVINTRI